MENQLEMLMKMKKVHVLDAHCEYLLDNAYNAVKPPTMKSIVTEQLPVMQQYIHKLIYKDLSAKTCEKTLSRLRRLDWNDAQIRGWVSEALLNIHHQKYTNLECVAFLLAGLKRRHLAFVIKVVDTVLESVR